MLAKHQVTKLGSAALAAIGFIGLGTLSARAQTPDAQRIP